MSYKQVPMFVMEDGKVLSTEEDAKKYDEYVDIRNWYSKNGLYSGCTVYFEDLVEYLHQNESEVRKLLDLCDFIHSLKE